MNYLIFRAKNEIRNFIDDEEGAGVIELVLIIVVLIGFVFLFKDKIGSLLNTVFSKINSQAEGIYQ
ncbi:MAG: holin, BlyA family protein [Lachnospiraceae bacterium]|nr:holin, BlyA family protein [Lachnospiraceae bacterium]